MLKLFISHAQGTQRQYAHELKGKFTRYGIEAFVAHDDIEPDAVWRVELMKHLVVMDALLFLSDEPGNASAWCNQELGYAIGSQKRVLSLLRGAPPVGFAAERQGIRSQDSASDDVKAVYATLCSDEALLPVLGCGIAEQLAAVGSYNQANSLAKVIHEHPAFTHDAIDLMNKARQENGQAAGAFDVASAINVATKKIVT